MLLNHDAIVSYKRIYYIIIISKFIVKNCLDHAEKFKYKCGSFQHYNIEIHENIVHW